MAGCQGLLCVWGWVWYAGYVSAIRSFGWIRARILELVSFMALPPVPLFGGVRGLLCVLFCGVDGLVALWGYGGA